MEDISKIVLENKDILQISFVFILFLGLIKIFTNKILSLLIFCIIGINVYYFTVADKAQKTEINIYVQKIKNITKEDVKNGTLVATDTVQNFNIVKTLPADLQTKLAEYGINETKDLVQVLEKNYNDVK